MAKSPTCCVPALTIDGFITNKRLMLSKIWEYFLCAEYSQSNIFHGKITSFKYIMATAKPLDDVRTQLEAGLEELCKRYFSSASCTVDLEEMPNSTHRVNISLVVSDDEKQYHLYNEVLYTNGKIETFEQKLNELYEENNQR